MSGGITAAHHLPPRPRRAFTFIRERRPNTATSDIHHVHTASQSFSGAPVCKVLQKPLFLCSFIVKSGIINPTDSKWRSLLDERRIYQWPRWHREASQTDPPATGLQWDRCVCDFNDRKVFDSFLAGSVASLENRKRETFVEMLLRRLKRWAETVQAENVAVWEASMTQGQFIQGWGPLYLWVTSSSKIIWALKPPFLALLLVYTEPGGWVIAEQKTC